MQAVYSTKATSTGGREGRSSTEDGRLSVQLSTPKELGGAGGPGTNPEQLFAAGYSACFIGAIKFVAGQDKIALPAEPEITAAVGIGANPKGVGFAITVSMDIKLPGLERAAAQALVEKAHQVCPYSNATRGNVDVQLTVV
ncbi:MAG TPA: organic hydroperoxide resistance protein [Limnobacter sp.]|nr:organic hydroperoxide resistance protein [Limnobacter sp.]